MLLMARSVEPNWRSGKHPPPPPPPQSSNGLRARVSTACEPVTPAPLQVTAVRLIVNRLFEDTRLQEAILAYAKNSLQRLVELQPKDLDTDEQRGRVDNDVQRLVSLCLGLCMKVLCP